LITNPNNPLGAIYPPSTVIEAIEFCKKHQLQLVVNELYANSCFDPQVEFHSVLSLPEYEANHDFIHVVYGLSKDFCISGYRVGILYTENKELCDKMGISAFYATISNDTQFLLTHVLNDKLWTENFLQLNRKRIKHSYDYLVSLLTQYKLDYVPAYGGFFLWLDLRKFLSPTAKGEEELNNKIFYQAKVNIYESIYFHCSEPGYFRLCFAISDEELKLIVDRIVKVLNVNQS